MFDWCQSSGHTLEQTLAGVFQRLDVEGATLKKECSKIIGLQDLRQLCI